MIIFSDLAVMFLIRGVEAHVEDINLKQVE